MSAPDRRQLDVLLDLRRWPQARTTVESLLATDPEDPGLHLRHADALAGLEELEASLDAASRAAGLRPDDPGAHQRRARALARLGRHEEALGAAEETVRLAPQSWAAHALLATTAAEVRGRRDQARDAADRAVTLAPQEAEAHAAAGFVATRRRHLEGAVRAYRAALAIDPTHAVSLHNLALLEGGNHVGRVARGVAGALREDPQSATFRATAASWTRRTVLGIWIAPLAMLLFVLPASLDNPPEQAGRLLPTSAFAALLLVTVLGGWWVGTILRLPRAMKRYAAALLADDPGRVAMLVSAVLGAVGLVVIGFSPREIGTVLGTAGAMLVVGLATLTWALVADRRRPAAST